MNPFILCLIFPFCRFFYEVIHKSFFSIDFLSQNFFTFFFFGHFLCCYNFIMFQKMEDLGFHTICIGRFNVLLQMLFNRYGLYLDNLKTDSFNRNFKLRNNKL